jgi:uncharacterized Fe-S cluster protein YjdI
MNNGEIMSIQTSMEKSKNRLQTYETPEITVTFDPDLCSHSGNCIHGLPLVFDRNRKRWIRPDLASADDVAAQIERCPSGALQYRKKE